MSHFSVLVITEAKPSQEDLAAILQKWHEYECTGTDDQYVVDVDITDGVAKEYDEPQKVVTLSNGEVYSRWDNRFYTKPAKERWGNPEFEMPDGAVESEISADEARKHGIGYATMAVCAEEYYGGFERSGRYYNRTNPNKKWDWWQLGGRWTGRLIPGYDPNEDPANKQTCWLCKGTGKREDMEVTNGCNGCSGTGIETKWPTQWQSVSDQMQMQNIPIDKIRDVAERSAADKYDQVHAILNGRTFMTWDAAREKHGTDFDAARTEYNGQEILKELREVTGWDGPDEYLVPRETYLRLARDGAMATFAVVKDGQWFERGKMGWWACVADEKEKDTWYAEFAKLIDGLPPSTWLSIVDCHI